MSEPLPPSAIAVIGFAGRFPGAPNVPSYWRNLCAAVESTTFYSDEELLRSGVTAEQLANPRYVKAAAAIDAPYQFDATYFGYSGKQAELIDPQQRIFLECALEALECAGCDPSRFEGAIGVFGGAGTNTYKLGLWSEHAAELRASSAFQLLFMEGNDCDFLATRVSYKLGLRGPSITVQTACSTSLVAVHLACQSLLAGESDVALAGAVSILRSYGKSGYFYEPAGIAAPDGHCRPFDAAGRGTVFGDGVGIVVLKQLERAVADGDTIHAVIRATAINNDGAAKVGYHAPSVDGQVAVISEAMALADVPAASIGYVEAHGTGTELGDPVEVAALMQAYAGSGHATGSCVLGAVKSNVGHLNSAAGIAGLLKVTLAVKHGIIPATLHYQRPNPNIAFARSPFYVNAQTVSWQSATSPRRAAVSSFGIGGTNAHAIVEQAMPQPSLSSARSAHVLLLSARTATALNSMTRALAQALQATPEINLADVAHTLASGRAQREHRCALVCRDALDAARALEERDADRLLVPRLAQRVESVAWLFPDEHALQTGAGAGWYAEEPVFTVAVDRCAELLRQHLGVDLRQLLLTAPHSDVVAGSLNVPLRSLCAFTVSYALAQVWTALGVRPAALLGSGSGAWVAACVAEVVTLEQALSALLRRAAGNELPSLPLRAPVIPLICAVTGRWIESGQSVGMEYWNRQLASAGLAEGLKTLLQVKHARGVGQVLLEVGPGTTLTSLARQSIAAVSSQTLALSSHGAGAAECAGLYQAAAQLWCCGLPIQWQSMYASERRRKLPLPTYPFERQEHGSHITPFHVAPAVPRSKATERLAKADVASVLSAVCSEILGVSQLEMEQDFSAIGGDSLNAVRIAARLGEMLGVDIPLSEISEARSLAEVILRVEALAPRDATSPARSAGRGTDEGLVMLRAGTAAPLLLLHPIGGGVQCYQELLRCLPSNQAVYACHAFGERLAAAVSIDAIATAYLQMTARLRSNATPLRLAGWSFGGIVAFEMARQLEQAGESVAWLGLIDAHLPRWPVPADKLDDAHVVAAFNSIVSREAALSSDAGAQLAAPAAANALNVFRRHHQALYRYRPGAFAGTAHLFMAAHNGALAGEWDSEWVSRSSAAWTSVSIPGDHFSLLQPPNAQLLAQHLMQHLSESDANIPDHSEQTRATRTGVMAEREPRTGINSSSPGNRR